MHYIIDGYNLVFNLPNKPNDLQKNRKEILSSLRAAFSNVEQEITIVFDGQGPELTFESFHLIQVVFTPKKLTADDYILEIISTSLQPTQITVISSDKKLIRQCKYYGSNVMNIQNFLKFLKNKSFKKSEEITSTFQDSKQNIDRLNKIFENKLKEF